MQPPITVVHSSRPKKVLRTPLSFQDLKEALEKSYAFGPEEELVYMDEEDEECLVDDETSLQIAMQRSPLQGLTLYQRPQGSGLRGRGGPRDVFLMTSAKSSKAYVFSSARMELQRVASELLASSSRLVLLNSDTAIVTGGLGQLHDAIELSLGLMEVRRLHPMIFGRFWHGIVTAKGAVVVSGGKDEEGGLPLAVCEIFDGEEWQQLPGLNSPRDSHTMAAYDTSVYVVGGEDEESNALASIEKLSGDKWVTLLAELPKARTMPGAVFVCSEVLVVIGGMQGGERKNTYRLNLLTGQHTELGPLPLAARFPSNPTACAEGVVYALDNATVKVFVLKEEVWSEAEVVRLD